MVYNKRFLNSLKIVENMRHENKPDFLMKTCTNYKTNDLTHLPINEK